MANVTTNTEVTAEKKYLDSAAFQNYVARIESTETLDELKTIGKELMEYGPNAYKKAVIEIYKARKEKIVGDAVQKDRLAKLIRNAFIFGDEGEKKLAAQILYALREKNVLDSSIGDYLFSLYKKTSNGQENQEQGDENQ